MRKRKNRTTSELVFTTNLDKVPSLKQKYARSFSKVRELFVRRNSKSIFKDGS